MKYNKKEYNKLWYEKNKVREQAKAKAYREKNKAAIKALAKAYHVANKDAIRERYNSWAVLNKDKIVSRRESVKGRYSQAKAMAKRRKYEFEISFEQYVEITKNGTCHYCNLSIGKTGGGLDRKNNEAYYKPDTVVPCCKRCNETFMNNFNYEEKCQLAETIRLIEKQRQMIDG